jgi:hypothetical protein
MCVLSFEFWVLFGIWDLVLGIYSLAILQIGLRLLIEFAKSNKNGYL